MMRRLFPRVQKHEYIVCSDSQDNKEREHVKHAEIPEIYDDAIDEVRAEEAGDNAEHRKSGDPERLGLYDEEYTDEAEAPDS